MSPGLQKFWEKTRKNQPFLREKNGYGFQNSGPTPRQKIIWVRATSMGSKISLLVIWMTPYKKPNLVYKWVDFSKFSQTWAKIGLDLRKLWKNCVILLKILPKIKQIGTLMGQYFLKTWYLLGYFYRSTFKVCGSTSLPKTKLEYPPGVFRWPISFFKFQSFRPRGSNSQVWFGQGFSSVTWHSCIPTPIKGVLHLLPQN